MLALPATTISQTTISHDQRCCKGRQMADNILDIEAEALKFAIDHEALSGIVSYDITAAFPSLSRLYLFWVLSQMLFPAFYIDAIKQLYKYNIHTILLNRAICMTLIFTSGVKQGCPLSMVLFALALDPIIRMMSAHLSPFNGIVRAYCDDIAIACANLIAALRHMSGIFLIIAATSNLHMNAPKTQLLCLTHNGQLRIKRHIDKYLPQLHTIHFTDAILYLVLLTGPGAF